MLFPRCSSPRGIKRFKSEFERLKRFLKRSGLHRLPTLSESENVIWIHTKDNNEKERIPELLEKFLCLDVHTDPTSIDDVIYWRYGWREGRHHLRERAREVARIMRASGKDPNELNVQEVITAYHARAKHDASYTFGSSEMVITSDYTSVPDKDEYGANLPAIEDVLARFFRDPRFVLARARSETGATVRVTDAIALDRASSSTSQN